MFKNSCLARAWGFSNFSSRQSNQTFDIFVKDNKLINDAKCTKNISLKARSFNVVCFCATFLRKVLHFSQCTILLIIFDRKVGTIFSRKYVGNPSRTPLKTFNRTHPNHLLSSQTNKTICDMWSVWTLPDNLDRDITIITTTSISLYNVRRHTTVASATDRREYRDGGGRKVPAPSPAGKTRQEFLGHGRLEPLVSFERVLATGASLLSAYDRSVTFVGARSPVLFE